MRQWVLPSGLKTSPIWVLYGVLSGRKAGIAGYAKHTFAQIGIADRRIEVVEPDDHLRGGFQDIVPGRLASRLMGMIPFAVIIRAQVLQKMERTRFYHDGHKEVCARYEFVYCDPMFFESRSVEVCLHRGHDGPEVYFGISLDEPGKTRIFRHPKRT